jgi:hypothetical protein
MENLLMILIAVIVIGFSVTVFFASKLFKEQKLINENLTSHREALTEIKEQLSKLEVAEREHKSVSQTGFSQIETALKETIKLD